MAIGTLYYSQSTDRGQADFTSMPFHSATIDHNRDKASSMSFKSKVKLQEADRIIYEDLSNNKTFGGQIVKRSKTLGGDYSYEVMDYTRLYQSKTVCSFSNLTSSQILKKIIKADANNLSTSGIQDTKNVHKYVKWDNASLWTIIEQLAWLEYKAGTYIYYDVDYTGTLIWKIIPQQVEGYSFSEAYDYNDSYDSSNIITQGILVNSKNPNQRVNALADNGMIAKWGYITEVTTCTPPTKNTSNKTNQCNTTTSTNETYWGKCGLSPDNKSLIAIGKPSAPGEGKYPYAFHKTVFQNKCPHCHQATLVWDWNWGSGKACNGKHEGGSAEGHIFCKNCDMDFGCLTGREHINGSNNYVKVLSKPVKSSSAEANKLKKGKLPYDKKTVTKKCPKATNSNNTGSLKNEDWIKKYNIPSTVWKQALELTSAKKSEYNNVKAIFKWMDDKIPYEGYSNTKYGAAGTLKRRKGNCVDHAHLFAAMCRSIGVKCNYIHNPCCGKNGHVYNKVYIGGKATIVDTGRGNASWGSHWGNAGCPSEKETINF